MKRLLHLFPQRYHLVLLHGHVFIIIIFLFFPLFHGYLMRKRPSLYGQNVMCFTIYFACVFCVSQVYVRALVLIFK